MAKFSDPPSTPCDDYQENAGARTIPAVVLEAETK